MCVDLTFWCFVSRDRLDVFLIGRILACSGNRPGEGKTSYWPRVLGKVNSHRPKTTGNPREGRGNPRSDRGSRSSFLCFFWQVGVWFAGLIL